MYGLRTGVGLYLPGEGHEHLGPGTSMVQRVNAYAGQYGGMGDCANYVGMGCANYVGMGGMDCANWVGMGDCANYVGMGCQQTGLGCACGGSGGGRLTCGVGCNDLAEYRGVSGLGLFDSGFDVSGWGWPEFSIAALGGYMLLSTFFTTKRAAARVAGAVRKSRRRSKKKRELKQQLRSL